MLAAMAAHMPSDAAASVTDCGAGCGTGAGSSPLGPAAGRVSWMDRALAAAAGSGGNGGGMLGDDGCKRMRSVRLDARVRLSGGALPESVVEKGALAR